MSEQSTSLLETETAVETTPETVMEAIAAQEELKKELETLEALTLPSRVGDELRRAREAKNFSISHVAQSLRLGNHQIEALEKEEWDKLPGSVFVIGFVRNYARLLEVESDEWVARLSAEFSLEKPRLDIKQGDTLASQKAPENRAIIIAAVVLLLALLAYFLLPDEWANSFKTPQTEEKIEKNLPLTVEESPDLTPPNVITESAEKTTDQ